jgi:hypothetical protein
MAEHPPGLSHLSQCQFSRTEELFSRSISSWDELEYFIRTSGRSIDEWIEIAEKYDGLESYFYASYLKAIKNLLQYSHQRKKFEQPRQLFSNRLRPSLLVKRV